MSKDSHLTKIKDFTLQDNVYTNSSSSDKPKGLWYQINNSWEDWCKYNMPQWLGESNRGAYKVNLEIDKTNVLVINTLEKFDSFRDIYCSKHPYRPFDVESFINWERVAQQYDGIEITHYLYERRLYKNCEWYYGWDIASGCIWNTNIVKVVGEITEVKKEESLWEEH